jgi:hypothetical protein
MNRRIILATLALIAALSLGVGPSQAAVPWGTAGNVTVANSEVTGNTPTCTYSSTLFVCISSMTGNVTSLTLAGMTAGTYYTFIPVQDGTGSRTLTQTSITGGALAAGTTGANQWDVWVIKATSATAATFVTDYPNGNLFDSWNMTTTLAANPVTAATYQTVTAIVAPGVTASNGCTCTYSAPDANFLKGMVMSCGTGTNAITCYAINPTATAATPSAGVVVVRIIP